MFYKFRQKLGRNKLEKIQQKYKDEKQPIFSSSSEFTPMTYGQRDLLFFLVRVSKKEGYLGEFQWCIDTKPSGMPPMHFILGVRPVKSKTRTFDINNIVFEGKEWNMISRPAQMKFLENAGYITLSSNIEIVQDEKNNIEEKWTHFTLNQLAYNYYQFMNKSWFLRLLHIGWKNSEKHLVTILVSIISGILGGLLFEWVKGIYIK